MGIWISVAIGLFVLGSIMALKPSGREVRLDNIRTTARELGLQPKLVACPDWLVGKNNEKGKGMMAQYGLVLSDAQLLPNEFIVLDGLFRHHEGGFALDKQPLDLPDTIANTTTGLMTKANFIALFWQEDINTSATDLKKLRHNLQLWAKTVQARQN